MSITPKSTENCWDYDAYTAIALDRNRHEIVHGEHFVNSAPSLFHQLVSGRIQFQLFSQITIPNHGVVLCAPVDLQLSDNDIVQPDLVVVLNDRRHVLTPAKINGVPNLVIEIVSPSNQDYDFKVKRALYERSGIPEYWIVSPDEHQILQLILVDCRYEETSRTDQVTTHFEPNITVDLTKVW